jgi:hypothetical protein
MSGESLRVYYSRPRPRVNMDACPRKHELIGRADAPIDAGSAWLYNVQRSGDRILTRLDSSRDAEPFLAVFPAFFYACCWRKKLLVGSGEKSGAPKYAD